MITKIIEQVAEIYGFEITFYASLNKHSIYHTEQHCEFYWDSDSTQEEFFKRLKGYFENIGAQKNG